jgi:hypothetical protein
LGAVEYLPGEINLKIPRRTPTLKNYAPANVEFSSIGFSHVKWVPCHHGMARLQAADGGDALHVWSVAANILNKQYCTANKEWSSSLGVERGANNSSQ